MFLVGHRIFERENTKGCARAKQNLQLFFIDDHRLENVPSRLGKDSKIAILVVEILHVFRQNMPECGRDERRIDKRFVRLYKILEQKNTLLKLPGGNK